MESALHSLGSVLYVLFYKGFLVGIFRNWDPHIKGEVINSNHYIVLEKLRVKGLKNLSINKPNNKKREVSMEAKCPVENDSHPERAERSREKGRDRQ